MTDQLERTTDIRRGTKAVITEYINEAKEWEMVKLLTKMRTTVKKFDEAIWQLCEVKEIENEIDVSEELNSRVHNVKKKIYGESTCTSGNNPQVEIAEVGRISSIIKH